MKKHLAALIALALAFCLPAAAPGQEIRLSGIPAVSLHSYVMTTNVVHIEPDGQRKLREKYTLSLTLAPQDGGVMVTCDRFAFSDNAGPEATIPALAGWSYRLPEGAFDEHGQMFGIGQATFEKLKDDKGNALPLGRAYTVFNSFVDFHSFCHVFAKRTAGPGKGIQDLHRVGDRIVHAAANGEAPVSLGSMVGKESVFRNGEITLELKGTGEVQGQPCAIVGYDSGESSLLMVLTPMPQVKVETRGGSRYWGDMFIDLSSQWVRKATLTEIVVSETVVPGMADKIHGVVERRIALETIAPR
jgi:hypothetical protein